MDAVVLFCGPVGRAKLVQEIIRGGKHVMTTKPFDLDPDAALEVLQGARRLGRILYMNSPSPLLSPDVRQINTWVKEYDLGRAIAARFDTWRIIARSPTAVGTTTPRVARFRRSSGWKSTASMIWCGLWAKPKPLG